jgi:DNA-binding NtrC family response regulator
MGSAVMQTHLLLVDDDPADLLAISDGLIQRWEGLIAENVDSAEAALKLLATVDYDVVIADVRLPGMDGIRFAEEALRARPDTPILLITAAAKSQQEDGLRAGASAYLEKPLDLDILVLGIRQAIQKAKLRRRVREVNARSSQESITRSRGEQVRKEIHEVFRAGELLLGLLRSGEQLTDFEWEVLENCSSHLQTFLTIKKSRDLLQAKEQRKLRGPDDKDGD